MDVAGGWVTEEVAIPRETVSGDTTTPAPALARFNGAVACAPTGLLAAFLATGFDPANSDACCAAGTPPLDSPEEATEPEYACFPTESEYACFPVAEVAAWLEVPGDDRGTGFAEGPGLNCDAPCSSTATPEGAGAV